MMIERGIMKYLQIKNGEAFFLNKEMELVSITEMVSEDIRLLLIMIGSDQSPSFDEDIASVANNAERIIYENLLEKLKDFCDRKDVIKVK